MSRWVGVDVGGTRKGFDVAVIDEQRLLQLERGLGCDEVVELVERARPEVVAIDSPISCAPKGRSTRDGERELTKAVCGIRWTPDEQAVRASPYYAWILEGLALFDALAVSGVEAIEVFPTASWTRWFGKRGATPRSTWSRRGLAALGLSGVPERTNQDQRDAIAAAVTARQYTQGTTETIGTIVVPAGRSSHPGAPPHRQRTAGILVRRARQSDLGALLSLYDELAVDKITAAPGSEPGVGAVLADILADPRRELAVASASGQVVGSADLVVVANLTHRGEPWAIVENVIVSENARRKGVGRALMAHLIGRARAEGCFKVQLLSGKHRAEAHALYKSMGFADVAEGFKIYFDE
ncbi:MAG: GNAT family N-acetyltransferase [Solirubrobacteraceae bacterium]